MLALALAGATCARGATSIARSYAAEGSAASLTNIVPAVGGGPFAIADFDGDRRDDVAQVQAGPSTSHQTQYWIQLRLTHMGRQLIAVVAPIGGLQVAASDVNGDHAVDLVLTTAWLNRPVAILLNDGHGRFTAKQPSAFPGAFRRAASERVSQTYHPRITPTATQSRSGVHIEAASAHAPPQTRSLLLPDFASLFSTSLHSRRGRAPPLS